MTSGIRSILDLLVVLGLVTVAAVVVAEGSGTTLQVLFGLPLVLFAPGYVLLSALYPARPEETRSGAIAGSRPRSLGTLERFVLSALLSVGIVSIVALGVDYTSYAISRMPVLVGVVGAVYALLPVAIVRRLRLPSDRRYAVGIVGWLGKVEAAFNRRPRALGRLDPFEPRPKAELFLNVAVVIGVCLLAVSVAFAAVSMPDDEQFTELTLLSENEDGDLVAEGFETSFEGGDPVPIAVAIGNHEGQTQEYTAVVMLQEVSTDGDETEVRAETELDRFETTVPVDTTETVEREVVPTTTGDDLRVVVLLYADDVPEEPSTDNAYRSVSQWITVEA